MQFKVRLAAVLLGGGMLLGTGSCLPKDFWSDAWGLALFSAVERGIDYGFTLII